MLTWMTTQGVIAVFAVLVSAALAYGFFWMKGWTWARGGQSLRPSALAGRRAASKVRAKLEPAGGVLRSPLGDRDVVWMRVVLDELISDDTYQEVAELTRGVPALLRDVDPPPAPKDGEALIITHSAQVDLASARVAVIRPEHVTLVDVEKLTANQREALVQLFALEGRELPLAGRVREHALAAGDEIVLAGHALPERAARNALVRIMAPVAVSDDEGALAYGWVEASLGIPA